MTADFLKLIIELCLKEKIMENTKVMQNTDLKDETSNYVEKVKKRMKHAKKLSDQNMRRTKKVSYDIIFRLSNLEFPFPMMKKYTLLTFRNIVLTCIKKYNVTIKSNNVYYYADDFFRIIDDIDFNKYSFKNLCDGIFNKLHLCFYNGIDLKQHLISLFPEYDFINNKDNTVYLIESALDYFLFIYSKQCEEELRSYISYKNLFKCCYKRPGYLLVSKNGHKKLLYNYNMYGSKFSYLFYCNECISKDDICKICKVNLDFFDRQDAIEPFCYFALDDDYYIQRSDDVEEYVFDDKNLIPRGAYVMYAYGCSCNFLFKQNEWYLVDLN